MDKLLKKLWRDYFADECSVMRSDEEKELAKKAIDMHEKATASIKKEQIDAIEEYIDTLFEIQNFFTERAFIKGCEFSACFFLEIGF